MSPQSYTPRGLEDIWRERVRAAGAAYLKARVDLEQAVHDSLNMEPQMLQIAHEKHDHCLQEYMQILRIFRNLVMDGVRPEHDGLHARMSA